jgi:ribosome biogenesis GTPase / thiamine phosphate phosphatase
VTLFLYEVFIKGVVSRIESKDVYVYPDSGGEPVRSALRGKFKKDFHLKKDKQFKRDIAVVGDYVEYNLNKDGTGTIHTIHERNNYISRKAPKIKGASYRGERLEQVIASNIDNFFIITSVKLPDFNNKTLDRFLVAGESSHVHITIIFNKIDLKNDDEVEFWKELYSGIGYNIILTSVKSGHGLLEIKNLLQGKKSIFWGQSGVGKSSLLNSLYPWLQLSTGEISTYHEKGIHTTVTSNMIRVEDSTYIIDTPGIREIDPFGLKKEDLGHYFPEFLPYINNCRFNTCTHNHEPECAVIKAVENEHISVERFESYLRILDTIEDDMIY